MLTESVYRRLETKNDGRFFVEGLHQKIIEPLVKMRISVQKDWVFLLLVFVFAGCASSSEPVQVMHNASSNETTYETSQMRLSDIQMTEGLGTDNRFFVQIAGKCTGQDCSPRTYTMRFIKEGMQSIQLEGREVRLTVGTETLSWDDPQSRSVSRASTIRSGTFAKVEVSSEQLATIGGVQEVNGTVGGESFSLSHEARAPIRKLLSRLENKANDS